MNFFLTLVFLPTIWSYAIEGGQSGRERLGLLSSSTGSSESLFSLIKEGDTILDVGCGSGERTAGLIEATGPSGKVFGIDIDENLIENNKKRYNSTFLTGDFENYNFSNKFDAIYFRSVLCHLNDPISALKKAKNLLSSDGQILIEELDISLRFNNRPDVFREYQRLYKEAILAKGGDPELGHKLGEILSSLGFSLIEGSIFCPFTNQQSNFTQMSIMTLKHIKKTLIEFEIATEDEISSLIDQMMECEANPQIFSSPSPTFRYRVKP